MLRSAGALDSYGPEFVYGHFVRVGSLPKMAGLAVGVGAAFGLAQLGPTRELLTKLKKSGEGAGPEQRDKAFFRVTIIAESRLELQATCVIEGDVRARRIKLEEGGRVNGTVNRPGTPSAGWPTRTRRGAPRAWPGGAGRAA